MVNQYEECIVYLFYLCLSSYLGRNSRKLLGYTKRVLWIGQSQLNESVLSWRGN